MAEPGGIVALLFTDLVGSTSMYDRIGDQQAEEVRRAHFAGLRSALAAHGGQEVKSLGDGLMVAFTSAVAAVEAAIAMQRSAQAVAGVEVRVGLHAGEPLRDEGDYFGVSVNTARRLCDAAAAGQILASDLIRALVSPRIRTGLRPVGELTLKGIEEPVWAYEVEWAPPADAAPTLPALLTAGADWPFVGHEEDLGRLVARWQQVAAGGTGVVLVAGEPGIGKTRLVAELARRALGGPVAILAGRSDPELALPLGPFAESLRSAALQWPSERRALLGATALEPLLRRTEVAPALPEADRSAIFGAVVDLLDAATAGGPVLWVLDDLHWADEATLLLLRHLLRLALPHVLFVVTYRDTELSRTHPLASLVADLRREANVERIVLRGLAASDVAHLLDDGAGEPATAALAERIAADTEGNPFFVHEIVRHLAETGRLVARADGRGWTVQGVVASIDVPEGVREVIGRRVSQLSAGCDELLTVASVIGRGFSARLLADVAGQSLESTLDAIDEALAARLLEEDDGALASFSFSHALVREALYAEVSTVRRLRLHLRIGHALRSAGGTPAEIAHHLLEAGPVGDDLETAQAVLAAAEDARFRLAAYEDAAAIVLRAFDQLPDTVELRAVRCDLLTVLGDSQAGATDLAAGLSSLRQAVDLGRELGDPARMARAVVYALRGGLSAAEAAPFVAAGAEARDGLAAEPSVVRARLRAVQVLAGFDTPPGAADALTAEVLAEADASGDDEARIYASLARADVLLADGRLDEARRVLDAGIGAIQAGLREATLPYGTRYFTLALLAGDRDGAEREMQKIADAGHRYRAEEWTDRVPAAGFALLDGRLDEAFDLVAQASGGNHLGQMAAAALFGTIALERGQAANLLPLLEAEAASGLAVWRIAVARFLIEAGRRDEAPRWTKDVVDGLRVELGSAVGAALVAEVAFELDDADLATAGLELLAPFAGRALSAGVLCLGAADRYRGLCRAVQGDLDGALELFERAEALNEALRSPLYVAHVRVDRAVALSRRNRPGDAEEAGRLAEAARDVADELGLTRVAGRAGAALGEGRLRAYD